MDPAVSGFKKVFLRIGIIDQHALATLIVQNLDSPDHLYKTASPARPTAPKTHDTTVACAAAPLLLEGAAAVALALELALLESSVDVPLGLPEMLSWLTLTPVLFLQSLL